MSEGGAASIRRILLALDATVHSPMLLEAAILLAARLDAELQALFVEDIDLLRLAELPFAREVRLTSATIRRLQNAEIERALRARAARAQEALAATATRRNVRWTFRVVRGQVATEVAEAATRTDLVAFALARGGEARVGRVGVTVEAVLRSASCPLLVLPAGAGLRPPFVVVYDGTSASARALVLAAELAQSEEGGLLVLIVAAGEERREQLGVEARAQLTAMGTRARLQVAPGFELATLASAVRFARAGTLVLAANSPMLDGDAVRQLLRRIECAALLVR